MQAGLCPSRKCASVPSLGHLVGLASLPQIAGPQDKGSQACFSPVFDLELDARLGASSNHLDRCFSHQQLGDQQAPGTSLLQQILTLCRCSSPVQAQLLQQLQRLRSAAYAGSPTAAASELLSGGSGHSADAAACVVAPDAVVSGGTFAAVLEEARFDVEAMACELLALGYMVQVRDGAQQQERSKTPRSCLQNLRHRYIVCLGIRSCGEGDPSYLPEPLVVEPRFREQFTIAHATQDYQALLQSVPPCFVGPVSNLEAVVKLMADQIHSNFKSQGLPVPPWRTRTALLSKWSPAQLSDLAAKIASLRRLAASVAPAVRAIVPCQSHDRLLNDERPAAAHADHAAVGSAPTSALHNHTAAVAGTALPWQLPAVAQGPLGYVLPGGHCPAPAAATGTTPAFAVAAGQAAAPPHTQDTPALGLGVGRLQQTAVAGAQTTADCIVEQPHNAVDNVLVMLAADGSCDEPPGSAGLKFTRKASAEWKHQRSTNRKIKGLLATALKKSVGGSRSNLLAAAAAAEYVAGTGAGTSVQNGTAAVAQPASPAGFAAGSGGDVLIRRTHFRAACDEPWRRITTVRLGAYAQQQHVAGPQQPAT